MPGYVDPGAIGMNIFNAFRQGQQEAQAQRGQNALAQYAVNPTPESLNGLAQYDPQFVMQTKQAQAQQAQQQQAAQQTKQRQDLPVIGRLLDHAVDEPSYQQALAIGHRYGLDVSQAPPNYDPQWIGGLKQMVQALQTPQGQEALSTAGKQAVDMGYQPGTPEFTQAVHDIFVAGESKPYVVGGETRLYTPKIGGPGQAVGGPQPGAVEDGFRFKGGNPADPSAWEPVAGGGGGNVTSGFQP